MLFGNNIWIGTNLKLFNNLLLILLFFTIFKPFNLFILINFVSNITNLLIASNPVFDNLRSSCINLWQNII